MEVEIISERFIKPSSPTPPHLKTYKISLLDQYAPATHIPMIFYYHNQDINLVSKRSMSLKQSLSETLTHYYPLAGRIKDTLSIDCNDEGVCYIEARANIPLSEYLIQPHLPSVNKLLPCKGNWYEPDPTRSCVTMVQETIFACGSITIGVLVSHLIVDGNGLASFLRNWAATSKSSKLDIVHPNFDGPCIFPQYEAFSDDATMCSLCGPFFKLEKFGTRRFVFDEWSMAKLKAEAAASTVENPTRFEAVSALLFECIAAVLRERSSGSIDRTNAYLLAVSLRQRANPPIPQSSLGNFVWLSNALCSPEEVLKGPHSARKLREAIRKIDSDFVKNIREGGFNNLYEKVKETRRDLTQSKNGVNFVLMTSWCNFGLGEVDFGWGKPIWVTCAPLSAKSAIHFQNSIILMDAGMGKGIEAWVFLEEEDLILLEKQKNLLHYASLNPSPLMLINN